MFNVKRVSCFLIPKKGAINETDYHYEETVSEIFNESFFEDEKVFNNRSNLAETAQIFSEKVLI